MSEPSRRSGREAIKQTQRKKNTNNASCANNSVPPGWRHDLSPAPPIAPRH